ncbi:MAG: enoyl-ACP reductase [Hydrogenophilales bacterium]
MDDLKGKKILVTGLLSERSISYGIANACKEYGAELIFTYAEDSLKSRTEKLLSHFNSKFLFKYNAQSQDDASMLKDSIQANVGELDGIVHSIAFAPRESLKGDFVDSYSIEGFTIAHQVSSHSLGDLVKNLLPLLKINSSIVTLTYSGSSKVFPNYNIMGLAKASLEANVRYLANSLGERKIRVNAISAGPIKTLAASGISGFGKLLSKTEEMSPLKENTNIEEVGDTSAFLLSHKSRGITGSVIYVDKGLNIMGIG